MNKGSAIGIGVGIVIVIVVAAYLVSGGIEDNIGNQPDIEEVPNGEESTEGQRFTITLEDGIGTSDLP